MNTALDTHAVRWSVAHLLGRIEAGIRLPDCAPSLADIREELEQILRLARTAEQAALED